MNVYRFKLIRAAPLYALTNDFFTCAEERLLSVSRDATRDADDLAFELTITDKDGEETMDSFATYPGTVPDEANAAVFSISSKSRSFFIALTIHRENPFECQLLVSATGAKARDKCLIIHDNLMRGLSAFCLRESVNPSAEARSFTLQVPPVAIAGADLVELERHLVRAAANHTRLSPSHAAQELRVTLELGQKSEAYSNIGQMEGHFGAVASFKQLSLKLWAWNDERKFQADITFDRVNPKRCELRFDYEGEGARAGAADTRAWIDDWIRKCSTGFYPRYLLIGPSRALAILMGFYGVLFSLLAFFESWRIGAILLGSLGIGLIFICIYGPTVWPYTRLISPKEEARHRFHMSVFKYVVGSLLLASVVVPTILRVLASEGQ